MDGALTVHLFDQPNASNILIAGNITDIKNLISTISKIIAPIIINCAKINGNPDFLANLAVDTGNKYIFSKLLDSEENLLVNNGQNRIQLTTLKG